jgi:hypothetical protein
MASKTLCITGFSKDEAASLQSQFEQANARLSNHWSIAAEGDADVLIIDMDSMYGHMSWLKGHSSGKVTVGVTVGNRAETDHVLTKPVDTGAFLRLLSELAGKTPGDAPQPRPAPLAPAPAPTPAPAPATVAPTPAPAAPAASMAAPVNPRSTGSMPAMPADPVRTTGQMRAMPADPVRSTGQMPAMPALPPADPMLDYYLKPGVLLGPVKIQLPGAPLLVLDPATQTYAGGSSLKVFLPYAEAVLREEDFVHIDGVELAGHVKQLGGSQPWARLAWLAGLAGGKGMVMPGTSPNAKFKLIKWPQSEREFPKHFRIATVMMKGPALLTEIAEQSGASLAEVTDFVNANLATGYAGVA